MESNENKLSFWKIMLIILLWFIILAWIFWALCWGYFVIMEVFSNMWGYWFFVISVPSLIIWLLIIFLWYKWIRKILKSRGNKIKVEEKIEL